MGCKDKGFRKSEKLLLLTNNESVMRLVQIMLEINFHDIEISIFVICTENKTVTAWAPF